MNKKVIAIVILFLIILIIGGLTIYYIYNSENYILTIKEISDDGIYAEQHIVTESTYPSDTTQKFKNKNGNTLDISELEVGTQIIDEYTNYVCNIEKIENNDNRIILTFSYNELYYFNLNDVVIKNKDGNRIDKNILNPNDTILVTTKKYGNDNTDLAYSKDNMALKYLNNVKSIQLIEND